MNLTYDGYLDMCEVLIESFDDYLKTINKRHRYFHVNKLIDILYQDSYKDWSTSKEENKSRIYEMLIKFYNEPESILY